MKTQKSYPAVPGAEALIKAILFWYWIGSLSLLVILAIAEWLVR